MKNKMVQDAISLNELTRIVKVNKSTLIYYNKLGLISPEAVVSRMYIFNKDKTLKRLSEIKKMAAEGKELEEIFNILGNME